MLRVHLAVLLFLIVQGVVNARQDATTPGELRSDSTPNSISIEWDLAGDTDHDATCTVQYRQRGSDEWLEAMPLFRVDYQWWYHTERADKPQNLFAGSLIFLEPDTTYERMNAVWDVVRQVAKERKYPLVEIYERKKKETEAGNWDQRIRHQQLSMEKVGRRILDGSKDEEIKDVPGWFYDNHPNANGVRIIADEEFKVITGLWPERLPRAERIRD